eukprot:1353685-Prorocentrum_lima.AAC.1
MMAISMLFRGGFPGRVRGDWAQMATSPLHVYELGAMNLVGVFDPAGFTTDDCVENFKRTRKTEITHGRISVQMVSAQSAAATPTPATEAPVSYTHLRAHETRRHL